MRRREGKTAADLLLQERAELLHYAFASCLYDVRAQPADGAVLFYNPRIDEPLWNHAGLIRTEPPRLATLVDEVRDFYAVQARTPTIATSSLARPEDLARHLESQGWQPSFRLNWLACSRPLEPPMPAPPATRIEKVARATAMESFLAVFAAAFADADGLATAYRQSFLTTASRDENLVVSHYLATVAGVDAAAGSVVCREDIAGLYNLSVVPRFRRQGLGAALTARRVADALAAGASTVFLLTEDASVERWQQRHGFHPVFAIEGYRALPHDR